MSASRFTALIMASLLIAVSLAAAETGAQEDKDAWQRVFRAAFQQGAGGTPIQGDQMFWAFAAAVLGFALMCLLTHVLVRVLAFLTILVAYLGGAVLLCWLLREQWITTWEMLAKCVAEVGIFAGVAAVSARLFLPKDEAGGDAATVKQLTQDVQELKNRLRVRGF